MPLLDLKTTQCMLWGDIINHNPQQTLSILRHSIKPKPRYLENIYATQLFCIYVNNLSEKKIIDIHSALINKKAYVGHIPASYFSPGKALLSTSSLTQTFLKFSNILIMPHPNDMPYSEDENILAFDFSQFGYTCRHIPEVYYSLFLTFKIERPRAHLRY